VSILSDSFSVLLDHWWLIAGALLILVLGQMLVMSLLKAIFEERLSEDEYFSLSLAGWMLPIILSAGIWLLLERALTPGAGTLVGILLIAAPALILFLRSSRRSGPGLRGTLFLLIIIFVVSLFLRLAFVSRTALPQYFDSAHHYLITKTLLNTTGPLLPPSTGYYHIGFHLLSAFVTSTLRVQILHTLLILGQVILAIIPLSIFFLVKGETRSSAAGIFAVMLATLGWYMPAYAVNWGKYPALASLPPIAFASGLAYLAAGGQRGLSPRQTRGLQGLLLLAIFVAGLTHSRSLIVLAILALAWLSAAVWQNLSKDLRLIVFLTVLLGIIWIGARARAENIFGPLFDPYWDQGLFVTCMVLLLSPFALWTYPKFSIAAGVTMLLLLGSLFIPVTVPGYGNLTLLDRPFVEMILYLPLSLLGGAGLAGVEQGLKHVSARWPKINSLTGKIAGIAFMGALLINAGNRYTFYPSDCCTIVGEEDLVALEWMDENLPSTAQVLISSTELWVLATDSPQGMVSGDAGAWVHPLTGRDTFFLPHHTDFTQPSTLEALCQMHVEYIYVGETGLMFNNEQLASHPDWYTARFSASKAHVYEVTGCR
jgi:hypothetical protein